MIYDWGDKIKEHVFDIIFMKCFIIILIAIKTGIERAKDELERNVTLYKTSP